jgi:beta-glucanase (GH16 family)
VVGVGGRSCPAGTAGGTGGRRDGGVTSTVIFRDDFAGPPGSPPDPAKWRHETGGGGWGNQELQTYTSSLANCHLDGHGHLVITATRTGGPAGPAVYCSARLNSVFRAQYGHIEARISMPSGPGLWPAFWMMGDGAPWPAGGELDIVEAVNDCGIAYQTAHGPEGRRRRRPWHERLAATRISSGFHVYATDWSAGELSVSVDGQVAGRLTRGELDGRAVWPFGERPMYLLLNLAVGGEWPDDPSPGTRFPASMLVDYVEWSQ